MSIKNNIVKFSTELNLHHARLIAVSKTQTVEKIREAYEAGQRDFGENKVQEMVDKASKLPEDIRWHLIGHLQRNKVKYIAPFISLIHSVDSIRLLEEIDKQAEKHGRIIHCLLQVFIATEETKFGLDVAEVKSLIQSNQLAAFRHVTIDGLMGMASLTENRDQAAREFASLKQLFESLKASSLPSHVQMKELSMGMTSDYPQALSAGSTMVRIGTAIFGERSIVKEP